MNNEGIHRMTTEEYEHEYEYYDADADADADATEIQSEAIKAMLSFSQAAKHAAVAAKRRRSPKSRTFYCMAASREVQHAFDALEKTYEMPAADFQLLKEAIGNFRVRLDVHDSKSLYELKQLRTKIHQQEEAAEVATYQAFMENTSDNDQNYNHQNYNHQNAKEKYQDLKLWNAELSKEIHRIEPKFKYYQGHIDTPAAVASQHAQIAETSGIKLRNILTPATIRRTFISLKSLTHKIREEVALFLTDKSRFKDRKEVVKQIKEDCIASALKAKKQKE